MLDRLGDAGMVRPDDRHGLGHRLEDHRRQPFRIASGAGDARYAQRDGTPHPPADFGIRQPAEKLDSLQPPRLAAQRAGKRAVADQDKPDAAFEDAHRRDQVGHALFLDEAADKEDIGIARGLHSFCRVELDPLVDDRELFRWKAARQEAVADEFRDADEERRLPLQGGEAARVDPRHEAPAVMGLLGRVGAVEGHDQRDPERPGDRQGQRTAPAEMRVQHKRAQRPQVGLRRQQPEMPEQRAVEGAERAGAAEAQRVAGQDASARIDVAAEPDRREALEPDIEAPEKLDLRQRRQAMAIDQQRGARAG